MIYDTKINLCSYGFGEKLTINHIYIHVNTYVYIQIDVYVYIYMKFVGKISKQGDDLIIKIPREKANSLKPLHGKPVVISVDNVEGVE
jgi:hypothetical protein